MYTTHICTDDPMGKKKNLEIFCELHSLAMEMMNIV